MKVYKTRVSVEESTTMDGFTVSYVIYNELKQCEECHIFQSKDYEKNLFADVHGVRVWL